MGRVIDVVIYHTNSNNRYKAFFEERQPGKWYGVRTEKMAPTSFFERMSMKSKAKKSKSNSPYAKLSVGSAVNKSSGKANVQGAFFIGSHQCPFCGNTNFVNVTFATNGLVIRMVLHSLNALYVITPAKYLVR